MPSASLTSTVMSSGSMVSSKKRCPPLWSPQASQLQLSRSQILWKVERWPSAHSIWTVRPSAAMATGVDSGSV